jgi:hypothetical protein
VRPVRAMRPARAPASGVPRRGTVDAMEPSRHIEVVTASAVDGRPRTHRLWFLWDRPDRVHLFWAGPERPAWATALRPGARADLRMGDRTWSATSTGDVEDGEERSAALAGLAAKYATTRSGAPPDWNRVAGLVGLEVRAD